MKSKTMWLGLILAACLTPGAAMAATVTADWFKVTKDIDGADLTVSGYRLFYATSTLQNISTGTAMSYGWISKTDVDPSTWTTVTIPPNTTYFFRLTALNGPVQSGFNVDEATGLDVERSTFVRVLPGIPQNVAATAMDSTEIDVEWDASTLADEYRLDVSPNGDYSAPVYGDVPVTGTSFAATGLTASTRYYVRVRGKNAGGFSGYASSQADTPAAGTPGTPRNVAAASVSAAQISVTWTAPSGITPDHYLLDVASDNGFNTIVRNAVSVSGLSTSVTGLTASTVYYVRVRAVGSGGGESPNSTIRNAMTRPLAPTVSASGATSTTINLTWTAPAGATGYQVDVSLSNGFGTRLLNYDNRSVSGTSLAVTGLTASTTYYARVRAVNAGGASANSATAQAATQAGPVVGPKTVPAGLKEAFVYPNPAVGKDPVIRAAMGTVETLEITIFNAIGRVAHSETVPSPAPAGYDANGEPYYEYAWQEPAASGVYFAVIHGKDAKGKTVRARAKFAVVR